MTYIGVRSSYILYLIICREILSTSLLCTVSFLPTLRQKKTDFVLKSRLREGVGGKFHRHFDITNHYWSTCKKSVFYSGAWNGILDITSTLLQSPTPLQQGNPLTSKLKRAKILGLTEQIRYFTQLVNRELEMGEGITDLNNIIIHDIPNFTQE